MLNFLLILSFMFVNFSVFIENFIRWILHAKLYFIQPFHEVKYMELNTLRPRQNGRHFADNIFKWIFLTESVWISINISLKFVPIVQINNIPALVQIMAWRRPGDKPLSEPMMLSWLTQKCVTRPQWVNTLRLWQNSCQTDNNFRIISSNQNYFYLDSFVDSVDTSSALAQVMALRQRDKPSHQSMMPQFCDAIWHY